MVRVKSARRLARLADNHFIETEVLLGLAEALRDLDVSDQAVAYVRELRVGAAAGPSITRCPCSSCRTGQPGRVHAAGDVEVQGRAIGPENLAGTPSFQQSAMMLSQYQPLALNPYPLSIAFEMLRRPWA